MKWQETKQDTAKHSKDFLRDTLRKLQAVQNGKNNVGQARLHRRLFLLFYRATARQRGNAKHFRAVHGVPGPPPSSLGKGLLLLRD